MRCGNFGCALCLLAPQDSPCLSCRSLEFQGIFDKKKRGALWLLFLAVIGCPVGAILLSFFYAEDVLLSFNQPKALHYTIAGIVVMGMIGSLFKYFHNVKTWTTQYEAAITYIGDLQAVYSELSESERFEAGQEYLEMAYLEVHSIGLPNTEGSFRLEI